MPTFLFKGIEEKGGIPRRSRVRVEALPKRTPVFNGRVDGSVALPLDAGKYAFSVACFRKGQPGLKYNGVFLWGLTEKEFDRLSRLSPKAAKKMNTTDGVRYQCQFTGCDDELTSATAAVLHEAEHQGRLEQLIEPDDNKYLKPLIISGDVLRARRQLNKGVNEKKSLEMEREMLAEAQRLLDEQARVNEAEKSRHKMRAAQRRAAAEASKE